MGPQWEGTALVCFTLFLCAVLWGLCKRHITSNPTRRAAERQVVGAIDSICNSLRIELDNKKFISRQTLQDVLHRNQVRQLLQRAPHNDYDNVSEHISSRALKFLALLILEGNQKRIYSYLDDPLGVTDDDYFGCAKEYDEHIYLWKEPIELSDVETLRDGHWKIPPALDPKFTMKYPNGFIMPFYNDTRLTQVSSFGTLYKAQVGGGHLENCDTVIVRN
jgi:hypothetical protein